MEASDATTPDVTERLDELIEGGNPDAILTLLAELGSRDTVYAISQLEEEQRARLFHTLEAPGAANLLERLPEVQAVEVLESLEPAAAAAIVQELPSSEQADLIQELSAAGAEAILQALPAEDAAEARSLASYDEHVAGGLMVTEYLAYRADQTVRDLIEDLEANADEYRRYDTQYAYVVDTGERLVGVLRIRDLLLARRQTPLREILLADPVSVLDTAPLEELADVFERHRFFGVPVVAADGTLLGVVNRSAVQEAAGERAGSDMLKAQGIVGGEELRSMPLLLRSRRRLSWLSLNIVLNVMAASVIAMFQDTLSAVIALAVFLPIISDMSGCSGNQAVAVSMRELTLGLARPQDLMRVWSREILLGLVNGLALGLLIGLVAYLWKGNPYLGLVVGTALMLNTMVAVSIGGCVPLVLKRWNLDPALASGPILTTITDMCGFLLALGSATLLLSYLT